MREHKMYFQKEECIRNYIWGNCQGLCEQNFLENSEYYLLQEYALTDGFSEYSIEDTKNNQGQVTTTRNIVFQIFLVVLTNNVTRHYLLKFHYRLNFSAKTCFNWL